MCGTQPRPPHIYPGMSTFDESNVRRRPQGVTGGGQFAHQAKAESGVTLAPSPKQWRADNVAEAFAETEKHGTATAARPRVMPKESLAALRADIKTIFGHKFSARMSSGTGYGWASVSWDDGPRERDVQTVVDGYCNERFNGMTDGYDRVNEESPVEYTLRGVNTSRSIGKAGQAYIDGVFDSAGLIGYQRVDPSTGERHEYDGGYDGTLPLTDDEVAAVEEVLGRPIPGRHTSYGPLSAAQLAHVIQAYTAYDADGKGTTDFDQW